MQESRARKIVDKIGARSFLKLLVEKHGISLHTIADLMFVQRKQIIRYLDGRSNVPAARVDCLLASIDEIKA